MKTKLLGPCTYHEAEEFCTASSAEYRLPTITELENILIHNGIEFTTFWSYTEVSFSLVWTRAMVYGNFWKGDDDHETSFKEQTHYALIIQLS